jgi:hypothetical protein
MESDDNESTETPSRITTTILVTDKMVQRFYLICFIVGLIAIAVGLVFPLVLGVE